MGSGHPPHRSQRALLAHWALTLGSGVEALPGPGMPNADRGDPAVDQLVHPRPVEPIPLAPAPQRSIPTPAHFSTKCIDLPSISGDRIVSGIAAHHAAQPPSLFGERKVTPSEKLLLQLLDFCSLSLGDRSAQHLELARAAPPTNVGETEEVEGLGLPLASLPVLLLGKHSEAQQPRLIWVQRQSKP